MYRGDRTRPPPRMDNLYGSALQGRRPIFWQRGGLLKTSLGTVCADHVSPVAGAARCPAASDSDLQCPTACCRRFAFRNGRRLRHLEYPSMGLDLAAHKNALSRRRGRLPRPISGLRRCPFFAGPSTSRPPKRRLSQPPSAQARLMPDRLFDKPQAPRSVRSRQRCQIGT